MKVKILNPEAKIPQRIREWDAGLSLTSLEDVIIEPGHRHRFKLGIAIEIDQWYVALTQWRSGNAYNYGVETMGNVIDWNYRWEIHVMLVNNGNKFFKVNKWDNIAQLVVIPVWLWDLQQVNELNITERWDAGFGSSDHLNK